MSLPFLLFIGLGRIKEEGAACLLTFAFFYSLGLSPGKNIASFPLVPSSFLLFSFSMGSLSDSILLLFFFYVSCLGFEFSPLQ